MRKLENKTALITGCSRGIGKAIMHLFAKEGASIVACARKETLELTQDYETLRQTHKIRVFPLYFDMSSDEEIKEAMKQLYALKINVDVLVNNAGMAIGGLLAFTKMSDLKATFQINYFAQVLITQYISKLMSKKRNGSIINIASILGLDSLAGGTVYGASKAALIVFTKSLAKELGALNIRVNAIAPGLVDTDMAQLMEKKSYESIVSNSAFKRLGTPEEITKAVLFLASDDSSYITGQIIRIDGGM
ncbi:MAG: SDR family oxidoreductase [Prevotellaceae bacterium]|jgi:3-oxoacyl-[acyl-carrier protein] reductase|nr:SDR family oxidoreductase [Prevotellaceae bacterium]